MDFANIFGWCASNLAAIFGWCASICMVLGYLPQAIATIRTRDTDGIAMPTFCMMGLGSLFFVLMGVLLPNWPLFVTNMITLICSVIVFGIKVYNESKKKK